MSDTKGRAGGNPAKASPARAKGTAAKPAKAPAKAAPAKPAKAAAAPARRGRRGQPAGANLVDPHLVLLHPMVTEKTMRLMEENNSLEFLVRRTADKAGIKAAIEQLFQAQVATVNTRITKDGKRAIVKFGGETSAEDIGMRIGVF